MMLWTAILLGLLGGVHCAGMCGPLMLALPRPAGGTARFVAGRIAYQLGRVLTYCALGLIFGLLGTGFALAGVQRFASVALGVTMLIGLLTSTKLLLAAPIARLVGKLRSTMSGLLERRSLSSHALLGTLNGLLPCGLVYVACAGAVATGSLLNGVAYMALFGLGTIPVTLGISLTGHLLPATFRLQLARLVPVGVVLVAALLILRGLSLGIPYLSPDLAAGPAANCACHSR
jgi:sulfite exporter TauE/SafE